MGGTRFGGRKGRVPDLGALDICLNVKSVKRSMDFYRSLGFRWIGGVTRKGWAILERDGVRIGLFHGYIKKNLLNFRGGDVHAIVAALRGAGLKPTTVKLLKSPGSGRAILKDPDGNVIFFDTTPKERKARKRGRQAR